MLMTVLESGGSFTDSGDDPKVKSRMRLQAAVSLLHLSTVEVYANALAPKFVTLAVTVQDTCYQVRILFLTKLISLLTPRKIPPRFNVIPFLTVHDPERDVKGTALAYVTFAFRSLPPVLKVDHLEIIFIRLLHLLAHHPDFSSSHEDLADIAKYIEFYLDIIANPESISLLYHLAMKAKTVRDAESPQSEDLYVVSELAQELVKGRCHLHSWSLQSYPGKVKLPSDILRALPNPETANKIMKTVYLPDETVTWLSEHFKPKAVSHPKEKRERKPLAKRKAPQKNGNTKRSRPRAKKRNSEDSDNEEATASEASDVEMALATENPASSEEDENEASGDEQLLGRGARTRAKARVRKLAKKTAKGKASSES
jgi:sister-chromatid-cohesion protein PDS5